MKSSPLTSPVLLTIEDDPLLRSTLTTYLDGYDYTIIEAENGQQGLEQFNRYKPDIVLLDLRLPILDGLDVLYTIHTSSPETPVIIVSGMGTFEDVVTAMKNGAWDYIQNPISMYPVIKEAVKMLNASLPATVDIKTDIAAGLEKVMADPTEILQVVMNLCTNGFHALKEEKPLTLRALALGVQQALH